jgi:REP element-mobilizing transposase RayT
MPRSTRKKSKTGIYHVMLRGINRQDIFEDEEDYRKMLSCLEGLVERCNEKGQLQPALCTIYAYCLMSNHIHLLVRERDFNLSEIVKKIGVAYAYYFNKKYDRYGHLFQDRFKSEPVEDSAYFLTLLRYIHQNPIKAGITCRVEDYQWSSWREYLGRTVESPSGMCDVQHVFSRYDRTTLEELILLPLENDGGILDVDAEVGKYLSDEDLRRLLFEVYGIEHPLSLQNIEKKGRNEIIGYLKSEGRGIRQLSRLTGLSVGLIQKI